nr:hypothetical protein [Saprospiraceae bacterium]
MTNETLIQRYDIQAFQVAQSFNIKRIRTEFLEPPIFANNSELYYHFEKNNRYLYIFDYGVVVFSNYDAVAKSEFLRFVRNFGESPLNDLNIFEEYYLEINDKLNREIVRNDYAAVPLLS